MSQIQKNAGGSGGPDDEAGQVAKAADTSSADSLLDEIDDILEVNEYLTSSLVVSPIDKWFMGPGARINREGLGVPSDNANIKSAIANARAALDRWDQTVRKVSRTDLASPALWEAQV